MVKRRQRENISSRLADLDAATELAAAVPIEPDKPYNPLDKKHLAKSVAEALLFRPLGPLRPSSRFAGAGIYAIYYQGSFAAYAPIVRKQEPIYVGKAVPKGSRRGAFGLERQPGTVLHDRLVEHAESIEQASGTLQLVDFSCRFLVVEDIFIPLGESLLIGEYSPIWNRLVPGFGNHDPGRGRKDQRRSEWDTVHPGRPWVEKLGNPARRTPDQILANLTAFFDGQQALMVDEETEGEEET